ncbi:LysR family transcriptional regulator [Vibrio comitans]|uniref:LysR family transcriptional regulator n=1 Tax=Vibrio comitans NBRC 102076 TaxID=1219078 RepID=A0A4Y3IPJ9_9VIBR|nr:LysR family transcriptional regulator [Vibrio comitans]GEA61187.1 LysR family transcriptional regulator [Vibrio comitans NBRC 102076]
MSVSLDQLRAFVATVDNKGMAQAARQVGKHVSTIREQINTLEIDTGLELFIRHPRSLEVTPEGEQLYKSAIAMLKESALFDANVESILQGIPDKLTIAIDSGLLDSQIDQLLAQLLQTYPHISLKVQSNDTMQIKSAVLSGTVDIGLIFNTVYLHDELAMEKAYSFDVVRVIPTNWSVPTAVDIDALNDKLQLSLSFLDDIGMRNADVSSHRYMLSNSGIQILNLIKAGVGWGYLPRFTCEEALQNGEVELYQESTDSISQWTTNLIWQKQKALNPAMDFFIKEMKKFKNR